MTNLLGFDGIQWPRSVCRIVSNGGDAAKVRICVGPERVRWWHGRDYVCWTKAKQVKQYVRISMNVIA